MPKSEWTGRAKAFDGAWYPVAIVGARVVSVAGLVSPNVAVEIDCTPDQQEAGVLLLDRLASAGWRNVSLCLIPPPLRKEPEA